MEAKRLEPTSSERIYYYNHLQAVNETNRLLAAICTALEDLLTTIEVNRIKKETDGRT